MFPNKLTIILFIMDGEKLLKLGHFGAKTKVPVLKVHWMNKSVLNNQINVRGLARYGVRTTANWGTFWNVIKKFWNYIFNRPGVAGAVLQTPLLLIKLLIN